MTAVEDTENMQEIIRTPSRTSTWKNRPLIILLFATFLLSIGNKAYDIVLPLMMYEITHSSVAMASMKTAELLPNFLFGVFIGVIVDRVNKKKWVLWMIGLQAGLLVLLAFMFQEKVTWVYGYYFIGFLLMTWNYGYFNAQISLTKLSVPKDLITSANAKFASIETLISVIGPVLSGLLLLLANLSDGILITAICYTLCLFLLWNLTVKEEKSITKRGNFWKELVEGAIAFKNNRSLWMMSIFIALVNCSTAVIETSVVFLAKDHLHLSSSMIAGILSFSGIGGLLGSFCANHLRKRFGLGAVYGSAVLMSIIPFLILTFFQNIFTIALSQLIFGFSIALDSIMAYSLRLEQTPTHLMGRITGITGTIFRTGMPIVMYISGWMILWWGTSSVFLTAAIWNTVVFSMYYKTHLWKLL